MKSYVFLYALEENLKNYLIEIGGKKKKNLLINFIPRFAKQLKLKVVCWNLTLYFFWWRCCWEASASIGQVRRARGEREGQASNVLLLIFPSYLLSGQYVFSNASDWVVNIGWGEREVGRRWLAVRVGKDCNWLGNCSAVHLVPCCSYSVPG